VFDDSRDSLYEARGAVEVDALHELSIAQNVIDSVLSEVEKNSAKKVLLIEISIGELMQLDKDAFLSCLSSFLGGPVLGASRLEVKTESAAFECRKCSLRWGMEETKRQLDKVDRGLRIQESEGAELPLHFLPQLYPAFVHCPGCGSSDILLKDGQSVQITKLVLE
jgi:hydrogenase nickel incorporation protein HypA/HybF